jgi:hypothetical protein
LADGDQRLVELLVRPDAFNPAAVPFRLLLVPAERALLELDVSVPELVVGAVAYGCVMPPL